MKSEVYKDQARLFGALSHPARLRILELLAQGEACVCHLCVLLQARQAYVSQQLATLKQAGLITDRRDGLYVYYTLTHEGIARLLAEGRLCLALLGGEETVQEAQVPEQEDMDCSCPRCQDNRQKPR